MTLKERVIEAFKAQYGQDPTLIVRAPGRVNLIGEHTDYNDGFVLPMAINRAVWIALEPQETTEIHLKSLDFDDIIAFDLSNIEKSNPSPEEYVKGVAWALQEHGYTLSGWQGVMAGDVPIGAGLSSSAALELAVARAFASVSSFEWDAPKMAKIARYAENEWVGVACGIMDQMISGAGEKQHALLIDCRSLDLQPVPLPDDTAIVILDTNTRRGLVGSAYNERRQQCDAASRYFGVSQLRDVSLSQLTAAKDTLDPLIYQRAHHIISENERVLKAVEAMQHNDAAQLGQLMNASHISLRDDYDVSSDALNAIVTCAQSHPACFGARMTGAGFGGCAVALVDDANTDDFVASVTTCYHQETGKDATVYVCQADDGASVVIHS